MKTKGLILWLMALSALSCSLNQPTTGKRLTSLATIETARENNYHAVQVAEGSEDSMQSQGSAEQTTVTLKLSLNDVIRLTLENNLDIKIVDYERGIAEDETAAQQGIFDPLFYSSYYRNEVEEESPTGLYGPAVSHETTKMFQSSLKQLLPTGGVVELGLTNSRFQTNSDVYAINPYYSARTTLSVVHPLLKNFGPLVTLARIRIAQNGQQLSQEKFRQMTMDQLAETMKTYWEFIFAQNNHEVQQTSLRQARDLLRINEIKYETGVLPRTDVLLAKAQVAAREEQVIITRATIDNLKDKLRQLLNLDAVYPGQTVEIVSQDSLAYGEIALDESAILQEAFSYRPDYQQLLLETKNLDIEKKVAKNQRWPELNLFGNYGFSGLDSSNSEAYEDIDTLDYNHWQAGAEFRFPLLNREARHRYGQATKLYDQAETRVENLENIIRTQLRNAILKVRTSRDIIDKAKTAVDFEQAKLKDEMQRFEVGIATSHDVLEYQTDLAEARARYLRSVTSHNQALIDLELLKGTLLRKYNITVSD